MSRVRLRRTGAVGAALAAIVLPLTTLIASPAAAAGDGLVISFDGVAFSKDPIGSVFPADLALVPGATATGTIHVRNDSSLPGELQLAVTGATASTAGFIKSLSMLAATPNTPSGTPVPLETGDACSPLLAGETIEPGASAAISLTILMDAAASNTAQASMANAQLQVSLRGAGAPDLVAAACEPGTGIPVTGGDGPVDRPSETNAPPQQPTPNPTNPAPASPGADPAAPAAPGADPAPLSSPGAHPAAPAVDTPPTAGQLPSAGYTQLHPLFPWIGVAALVTGVLFFLVRRNRERQPE